MKYGTTKSDIAELENVDRMFLNKLMGIPRSTPKEAVYLELSIQRIEIILMKRRLMYLKYLLSRNPESMLGRFFRVQWNNPCRGDWTEMVRKDLLDLKILLSIEEIKEMSKTEYERLIKEKVRLYAFEELIDRKNKHKKMSQVEYEEDEIKD